MIELQDIAKAYGDVRVFERADVHIERGDRVALVGPNGAGKSTLMRMLSGVEMPDRGERIEGHRVITQYFAQDEAVRLDGSLTVYETLASGSPVDMVPAIRNILGGFLFTEDDVHKRVKVLSGGERTRLAVARMLLRPSNTLILDEPTNHLDIDSTDVLLDALTDYGGTLIFVSHDRYFVDRLATKVIDVGHGQAALYPGTYEEFRWSKEQTAGGAALLPVRSPAPPAHRRQRRSNPAGLPAPRTRPARPPAAPGVRPGEPGRQAPARPAHPRPRRHAGRRPGGAPRSTNGCRWKPAGNSASSTGCAGASPTWRSASPSAKRRSASWKRTWRPRASSRTRHRPTRQSSATRS